VADAEPAGTRASPGALLAWCALVAAVAAGWLWLHAAYFDPSRLHVSGRFVDQGGYVTTARVLADTGELRSGIIYPAYLDNPRWRPYMPGHYAVLAATYRLLGYSPFSSLLPSLLGYVLAAVATFLIAERYFGRACGLLAAWGFLAFAGSVTYAFTAMAEMTFTAAGAVAFAAWARLPDRGRWVGGPLLLAVPFLFRETGAAYVLPMALPFVHGGGGRAAWKRGALFVAACVALLGGLNAWQMAAGKGAVPLSWITEGRFNYANAFPEASDVGIGDWIAGLGANLQRNVAESAEQLGAQLVQMSVVGQLTVVAAFLFALGAGLARRGRDPLQLGAGLMGLGMLTVLYLLYDVKGQKAMRSLLFAFPIGCAAVAGIARPGGFASASATGRPLLRAGLRAAVVLAALAYGAWNHLVARVSGAELVGNDEIADSGTDALRRFHRGQDSLVAAPFDMMMDFAVSAYPTPVSFTPDNDATLLLLAERYEIGTLVVLEAHLGTNISQSVAEELGLVRFFAPMQSGTRTYAVFQRAR